LAKFVDFGRDLLDGISLQGGIHRLLQIAKQGKDFDKFILNGYCDYDFRLPCCDYTLFFYAPSRAKPSPEGAENPNYPQAHPPRFAERFLV